MGIAIDEVLATTVEPSRDAAPAPAIAAPRPDPEAILALLRRETARRDRLVTN